MKGAALDTRLQPPGGLADLLLFGLLSLVVHLVLYLHWQQPLPERQLARPNVVEISLLTSPPPRVETPPPAAPPVVAPAPPPLKVAPPKPRPAPTPRPKPPTPPPKPAPTPLSPAEVATSTPVVTPASEAPPVPATAPTAATPAPVASLQPAHTRATSRNNPKPDYPALARRRGWEGKVLLRIHVLASGLPDRVEVEQGSGRALFDESAVRTVKQWTFTPAMRGTVVEDSTLTLSIVFKLDN